MRSLHFFTLVDTFGFKGLTSFDKIRFSSFAYECMSSNGLSSMSVSKWSSDGKWFETAQTAVGLEEAVGLSTGRRCSLKLAVFKSSFWNCSQRCRGWVWSPLTCTTGVFGVLKRVLGARYSRFALAPQNPLDHPQKRLLCRPGFPSGEKSV